MDYHHQCPTLQLSFPTSVPRRHTRTSYRIHLTYSLRANLFLPDHFTSNTNRMCDRLSLQCAQLLRRLRGLVGIVLGLRVPPLKEIGEKEIDGVTALRNEIADEGTRRIPSF